MLDDQPFVSIVIVTWNSARDLPACLEALERQDYSNLEIVVVDNASQDESLQIAREKIPNAIFICNPENRGFCGGHNQGINASHGEYYLPLNPDVELEPGFISAMVEVLESDPKNGMAAACLYLGTKENTPRRFDSTGLFIDRKRRQYLRGHGSEDTGQYSQIEEVFGVDGAAPLYRREMLEDIRFEGQYFDEAFHSHKEDVDLAWRARIYGWRAVYTPLAVAYHQRTFRPLNERKNINPNVKLHSVKNRYMLLIKNESPLGWRRDGVRIIFYDLKILVYLLLFERYSLKALALLRQNWKREMAWRKEIQRKTRVPSLDQIKWFIDPS